MDQRKWDPINHVAAGQFTTEQRRRLEAVTAARLLLGTSRDVSDLVYVAEFICGTTD